MIFYSNSGDGLTFLIDQTSITEIDAWAGAFHYPEELRYFIMGSCDGTPSWTITIQIKLDAAYVNVFLPYLCKEKEFVFEAREGYDLSSKPLTGCPNAARNEAVVVGIRNEIDYVGNQPDYQQLQQWECWVNEEAFIGRYHYSFFNNDTYDQAIKIVIDNDSGAAWQNDDRPISFPFHMDSLAISYSMDRKDEKPRISGWFRWLVRQLRGKSSA